MRLPRQAGVLLHPTSLPSPGGIGDLGPTAYRFVDWLVRARQAIWQMLPLGPTGMDNSPYAASSAFAGNPLLISLERLAEQGLLDGCAREASGAPVDYDAVIAGKGEALWRGFSRFAESPERLAAIGRFAAENADALRDSAFFATAKQVFDDQPWTSWPEPIRRRDPAAMRQFHQEHRRLLAFQAFLQMALAEQWAALKSYANERGIRLMGDVPIFVAHDSADVWAHPELFRLDDQGQPIDVAGVPPDYFSATGQLWGNPIYDWQRMAADGWQWWIARFRHLLRQVDLVRIDHFRGFAAHWSVPASELNAIKGRWEPGPGAALFRAIETALGEDAATGSGQGLPIVAEDLGTITDDVVRLRDELGYPGMKVLHFAFTDPANLYLPHNYPRHCVVYTGTHDNDTTEGWYTELPSEEQHRVRVYLGSDGRGVAWDLIRLALMSVADTAVVPLQDVLELGTEARMNVPGQPSGNWSWRFQPDALTSERADRLAELTCTYGRAEPLHLGW